MIILLLLGINYADTHTLAVFVTPIENDKIILIKLSNAPESFVRSSFGAEIGACFLSFYYQTSALRSID